jgi:hypothetical protein
MEKFFTRDRFGRPQFLAGCLLLVFLLQCLWLSHRSLRGLDASEGFRINEGLSQLHGGKIAGTPSPGARPSLDQEVNPGTWFFTDDGYDPYHSPLWYLTAAGGLLLWPGSLQMDSLAYWGWLAHAPYLAFGLLLGASLWYVARRLYGNAGGYTALALYCFSPGIIRATSLWFAQPEIGAAWGTFGTIFTAIAVAHTLYAPREVVLWNWRRILLLGVSFALAVGSQFSLLVTIPLALALMLYVAPTRRMAAIVICAFSCAVAALLLFSSYFFHAATFWQSLRHANLVDITWRAFIMPGAYEQVISQLGQNSPALLIAIPAAIVTYLVWPRARYFGNTAPLIVAVVFLVLAVAAPHDPGQGFHLMAVPFLFVFVAGIAADLLETPQASLVRSCIFGLLLANSIWNLSELLRHAR